MKESRRVELVREIRVNQLINDVNKTYFNFPYTMCCSVYIMAVFVYVSMYVKAKAYLTVWHHMKYVCYDY